MRRDLIVGSAERASPVELHPAKRGCPIGCAALSRTRRCTREFTVEKHFRNDAGDAERRIRLTLATLIDRLHERDQKIVGELTFQDASIDSQSATARRSIV